MKSFAMYVGAVAAGVFASMGSALANFNVPEPGSLSLVGVAVVGVLVAARVFKK